MVVLSRHLPAKLTKWQLGHLVALLITEGAIFVHLYTFLKLHIYHDRGGKGANDIFMQAELTKFWYR